MSIVELGLWLVLCLVLVLALTVVPRVERRRRMRAKVCARWTAIGLPGKPSPECMQRRLEEMERGL